MVFSGGDAELGATLHAVITIAPRRLLRERVQQSEEALHTNVSQRPHTDSGATVTAYTHTHTQEQSVTQAAVQ